MAHQLRDFLFIDSRRIESYFLQLHQQKSFLVAEKASSWEASLKVPDIGIKGATAVHFRDPTIYEKLDFVEKHIRKSADFSKDPNMGRVFGEATFEAQRWVISSSGYLLLKKQHLAIWVPVAESVPPNGRALYLLESCPEADSSGVYRASGYTVLEFLLRNLKEETRRFRKKFISGRPDPFSPENVGQMNVVDDIRYYLPRIAESCSPRLISCFYRLRASFFELPHGHTSIAYPLSISSHF